MYKIVGADQKEYGPVSEDQLRQWILDNRANAQTLVRFGDGPWKPLATFPEFASALGLPSAEAPSVETPVAAAPPSLPQGGPVLHTPPVTSGMAVAGLTCSILGLFCCGPILSTLGLIFSAIALARINQEPSRYAGRGLALTGIALALLGYLVFALLLSTGVLRRSFRRFPRYL